MVDLLQETPASRWWMAPSLLHPALYRSGPDEYARHALREELSSRHMGWVRPLLPFPDDHRSGIGTSIRSSSRGNDDAKKAGVGMGCTSQASPCFRHYLPYNFPGCRYEVLPGQHLS